MQNGTDHHCDSEIIEQLYNSTILHVAEAIQLILSLLAIPLLLRFLFHFQNSKFAHLNLRIIAWFHIFCLLLHCFGRIVQHAMDLYMYYGSFDICERRPSVMRCFSTRVHYVFGLFSSSYSTVFMVIERTIATRSFRTYENRKHVVGGVLLIAQLAISFATTFCIFNKFNFKQSPNFCSASRDSNPMLIVAPEILILVCNSLAFFQFDRLLKVNSRLRIRGSITMTMGQKYQVEENMKSIRMLRKFTTCDFLFVIFYFSMGIPFHYFGKRLELPIYYAMFESIYIVPIYSIVMPTLIYKYGQHLQHSRVHRISDEIHIPYSKYFEQLQQQWS